MKFGLLLALLVRVTGSLGGEMGGKQVVEARGQDIVEGQLVVPLGNLAGQLDIWQNKSSHLMDEDHQVLVKGEKMPTLNYSILK